MLEPITKNAVDNEHEHFWLSEGRGIMPMLEFVDEHKLQGAWIFKLGNAIYGIGVNRMCDLGPAERLTAEDDGALKLRLNDCDRINSLDDLYQLFAAKA